MTVHSNILHREIAGGAGFLRNCCAAESTVQRFELAQTLKGHYGCVNTVNWNSTGSLLVSGSDDTRLCIYEYNNGLKLHHRIDTGHTANIFSAKFLPFQDDRLVCCAGDEEVRTFHNFEPDQVYTCHAGRVKKIATHVETPHTFLSASEDGTVRHFDVRIRGSDQGDHIVVAVGSHYGSYNLEVYSLAYDPTNSNYFIIGGGDPYVRMYDMRVLGVGGREGERRRRRREEEKRCLKAFCPSMMKGKREFTIFTQGHITGVAYSYDGRECLATYSGDGAYLFDINDSADMRTIDMRASFDEDDDNINNNTTKTAEENEDEDESKKKGDDNEEDEEKRKEEEEEGEKEKEEEKERNTFVRKYIGHRNLRTVKEINFYGPRSEYVVSGSDCGRIFIWNKKTAKLENMMKGDRDVVNCCSGHPFDAVMATSGIESNIKIWVPKAENMKVISAQEEDVIKENTSASSNRRVLPDIYALLRAFTQRDITLQDEGDEEEEREEEGEGEGEGEGGEGEGSELPNRRRRWRAVRVGRNEEEGEGEEGEEEERDEDGRVRCEYQ